MTDATRTSRRAAEERTPARPRTTPPPRRLRPPSLGRGAASAPVGADGGSVRRRRDSGRVSAAGGAARGPARRAPPAAPVAIGAAGSPAGNGGGETAFTVDYPEQSSRLWALLYLLFGIKAIVLIVHAVIFMVVAIGAFFVFVVAQAIVLFTGRMPAGMHRFQTRVLAQGNKMNAWVYGLTDVLPPFALSDDPYPVETSVGHPAQSSRLWALLNILLVKPLALLPHLIVLYVLQIASGVVVFIAQIMILVTGSFPRGMFDFVVGVTRWQTRVAAFMLRAARRVPALLAAVRRGRADSGARVRRRHGLPGQAGMPYNETSPTSGSRFGGALAQLGERLDRTQEVSGSIPLCSTISLTTP